MSEQRWQSVFEIFEDAIDKPAAERRAFLQDACGDDPLLARGVEELLQAHDQQGSVLDRPLVDRPPLGPAAGEATGEATERSGPWAETLHPRGRGSGHDIPAGRERIGPYRVLRQIGQGGMSTVYMAAREDDAFHRRMVIKVVRSDRESSALLDRLRAERQILANLEHPNIARLYDGGSTQEGIPYFVMEYVEGMPIDLYCERNQLSFDERLTLFRKVCAAVHYAHQNLVVHRDIKPSNILVTADGEPKLLDFGIAKVLNPGLAGTELEPTAEWQRLMTPSFASPEQVRGDLITTVSDVYSLGVLLYVLLTGRLPHQFAGLSLRQIERKLVDTEPPRPSLVVPRQDTTSTGEGVGLATASEPSGEQDSEAAPGVRRRHLLGDVDAIVLKALRSIPSQRYVSVERFAADIERFQTGLPVEARTGSWRYRTGKFVRRNRTPVALAVIVATLLAGFTLATILQAKRIAVQRDKKSQVVSLILEIFALSDPYVEPGKELTVREAVERSLPLIDSRLHEQPEVRAELLHTTGSILGSLGVYDRAAEQLEEALAIRTELLGDEHLDVAETMSALAGARKELIELDEAERLARRAVEIQRGRLDPGDPALVRSILQLVSVYCFKEQYDAAEPLAQEVLSLTDELRAEPSGEITALEYLAQAHGARGDYTEAAALNRRALALSREVYGEHFPARITTLNNTALYLRRADRLEEARQVYEQALLLQRQIFGQENDDPVLLNNLAGVRFATDDFAGAEDLYRQAVEVVKERYGAKPWMIFSLHVSIARSRIRQDAAAEAEHQLGRLLEQGMVADDHWLKAVAVGVLGESVSAQGRCQEAEPLLIGSFNDILETNPRHRVRQDAFERLRGHLERCGRKEEIRRFEAMLSPAG